MNVIFAFLFPWQENQNRTMSLFTNFTMNHGLKVNTMILRNRIGYDYDYYNYLKMLWGMDDIIVIEGDIIPKMSDLISMIECKHSNCTGIDKLYPKHTGLDKPVFGQRNVIEHLDDKTICEATWIKGDEEFCDLAGLNFTKISLSTQQLIKKEFFKQKLHWRGMDNSIAQMTYRHGIKYHLHPETEHDQEGSKLYKDHGSID